MHSTKLVHKGEVMRLEFKGMAHGMCINQYLNNLLKEINEKAENEELYFVKNWNATT